MPERPVAFRVKQLVKIRALYRQKLIRLETVKPQQEVRLIQPVLPQQRRGRIQRWQGAVLVQRT